MKRTIRIKRAYLLLSVIAVCIGLWLMIFPQMTLEMICEICGIFFVAYGFVKVISYFCDDIFQLAFQFDFGIGIISVMIGFFMIFRAEKIVLILPAFIGLYLLIDALFKLQTAFDARRFGLKHWWVILIFALATGVVGGLLMFLTIETMKLLLRIVGFNLCLDGLLNIWVVIHTVRSVYKREE